jgi:peptidoglycan hydrolase CwlO-like protein
MDKVDEMDELRGKIVDLQIELNISKHSERELSDAYLRVRKLVGAWDTKVGGEDRFEVTEGKIKKLQQKITELEAEVARLKEINREVTNAMIESNAIIESIGDVMAGESVSDFMESYPLVREIIDMKAMNKGLTAELQAERAKTKIATEILKAFHLLDDYEASPEAHEKKD